MTNQNDEKERSRLAEVYAGMADGELANIAADGESLTDAARLALEEEIRRRGDLVSIAEDVEALPAKRSQLEYQDTVAVRQFRDMHEALVAKGSLDSAGIECWLGDFNMVRADWFISNALGGIKLQVKLEDLAIAKEILDQPIAEGFDQEEAEDS